MCTKIMPQGVNYRRSECCNSCIHQSRKPSQSGFTRVSFCLLHQKFIRLTHVCDNYASGEVKYKHGNRK